jgi:hypothetical protein
MKPLGPEKPKPVPQLHQDFKSWADRDAHIISNADYFTVGRRLGPRLGYERHEVKSLLEAESLARRMAKSTGKVYMIYAVAGISDCFVRAIHPN